MSNMPLQKANHTVHIGLLSFRHFREKNIKVYFQCCPDKLSLLKGTFPPPLGKRRIHPCLCTLLSTCLALTPHTSLLCSSHPGMGFTAFTRLPWQTGQGWHSMDMPSSLGSDSRHQAMVSYPTWRLCSALDLHIWPPLFGPLRLWQPPLCPRWSSHPANADGCLVVLSSNNNRTDFFWKGEGKLEKVVFIY